MRTFDSYQGNENDYIIVSFVRSNKTGKIGFLEEASRANVVLTRARRGFVLVGNVSTMKHKLPNEYNPWKEFVQYAEVLGAVKPYNQTEDLEKLYPDLRSKRDRHLN